jgi:hypothetical protein
MGCSTTLEELIARQRENLSRTFRQSEEAVPNAATVRRLAKTERELAEATAEFTAGIEQRAGPVPCLHEAQEAMEAAAAALEKQQLKPAGEFEEAALAGLIQARQNLRQFLSQNSASASACRKFDAQQEQKLRKPPQKDKKAELAKLQEEIEKLAKEEKKFSEEMAGKGGKPSESQGTPAQRQEKAAAKAAELQKLVGEDEALTDLARERMDAAAEAVQASAKATKEGREAEAGQKAGEAAEQLERLARQVAGLKAAELGTRLARSEALARELARRQQGVGKELGEKRPGAADEERRLAEEARTLTDLLKRLQEDAAGKNPDLARQLREADEANPPQKAAEQMGRAADALKAGKSEQARRDVDESARLLDGLGRQLEAARHGLGQMQLERLMALEKQAAEAQKALDEVNGDRQKAEAEKKVTELREALEGLQPADAKVTEAASALRPNGGDWRRRPEPHDPRLGAYVAPREYAEGVPKVVQALQAKIQEVILKDVLLDKDEAVPPQYKALVEEYYRFLSEDLRRR